MKRIWDISRPLKDDLAPWPGDKPFRFDLSCRISSNSSINVGALSMSVHNGTHSDAPFHFDSEGGTMDSIPLENYLGPAVVIDLSEKVSCSKSSIAIADLENARSQIAESRRLLLKTNCFPNSTQFPDWIPVLELKAIAWLRELRVVLLGVDVPSVDAIEAKVLANHHALTAGNIAIVESLDLSEIEPGVYQFAALPLRVIGGDAAPVRALLWRE